MKDAGAVATAPALTQSKKSSRWLRGVFELFLILALWVIYSLARLIADTSMGPALERANELLHVESILGIQWEVPLNQLFSDHKVLGLAGSYWYASLHYVVIRQQPTAENGEIVAAMIDGEATVKTFQRKDGNVWLLPHNVAYDPIDGTNATILGKVTAVLRRV